MKVRAAGGRKRGFFTDFRSGLPPFRQRRLFARAVRGFTMIELIVVMILVGIMAVTVFPRMSLLGAFDARGFGDQTEAYLRFAQKTALAQRRTVRIDIADATTAPTMCLTATYADACPAGCGGLTSISLPATFRPGNGSTLDAGAGFCFDPKGAPSAAQTIEVKDSTGVVARTVTVQAETGYVQSN